MRLLRTLTFCIILGSGFVVYPHPEDELVITEIEQGQLALEDEQMTTEYMAALKRQRMRRLAAMPWQEKFLLFIKAGVEHIIPKGLDHILFVLGLFFSSLIFRSLLWQVTAFTLGAYDHFGTCSVRYRADSRFYSRTHYCSFDCLDRCRKLYIQANEQVAAFRCILLRIVTWFGFCSRIE